MRLIDAYRLKEAFSRNIVNGDVFDYLINAQPTVDAVPVRHGEWINVNVWYGELYECSECGTRVAETDNYCPHCGAKMDVERKEEWD